MGLRDDYRYSENWSIFYPEFNEKGIIANKKGISFKSSRGDKNIPFICSVTDYEYPFNPIKDFFGTNDQKRTFIDVVTKKYFTNSRYPGDAAFDSGVYSLGEYIDCGEGINSDRVVEILKSLSDDDVKAYLKGMNDLEHIIRTGLHNKYYAKQSEEQKIKQKIKQNDDFINRFGR